MFVLYSYNFTASNNSPYTHVSLLTFFSQNSRKASLCVICFYFKLKRNGCSTLLTKKPFFWSCFLNPYNFITCLLTVHFTQNSYSSNYRFQLYFKLLLAMGLNWTMEVISWVCTLFNSLPDEVWYLTDFCNAIYGVFIFFIFVFKKNIWILLRKRYWSFTLFVKAQNRIFNHNSCIKNTCQL